jgi:WD40 repeat protein
MGPCCGPCHDRREEHATLAPGAVARTVLISPDRAWTRVLFAPDGRLLTSASQAGVLRVWDLATGTGRLCRFGRAQPLGPPTCLALAPDGRRLAIGQPSGGLYWHLDSGQDGPAWQTGGLAADLAFSPDGARVALAAGDSVHMVDPGGRVVREIRLGPKPAGACWRPLALSPDGRILAVAGGRSFIRLFDAATGQEHVGLDAPFFDPEALAFAPDGRLLAAAGRGHSEAGVRLWRFPGGGEAGAWHFCASGLAFAPDGRLLAALARTGRLGLWDARAGRELGVFRWDSRLLATVAFSPDGRWVATGAQDGVVKLWPIAALLGEVSR